MASFETECPCSQATEVVCPLSNSTQISMLIDSIANWIKLAVCKFVPWKTAVQIPMPVTGHRFSCKRLLAFRRKTPFLAQRVSPLFFRHFLSQDALGVYPVTLSLWTRLSLFGADFRWGASCELGRPTFHKATKSRDTWRKKRGPEDYSSGPVFGRAEFYLDSVWRRRESNPRPAAFP